MKSKRLWIASSLSAVALLGLLVVAATHSPARAGRAETPAAEIKIENFSFTPATVTVKAGTPVTWVNRDDMLHNVVSAEKTFKSKTLDTDEKFTFTPRQPGTYTYYCGIHPKMTGTLVVQ